MIWKGTTREKQKPVQITPFSPNRRWDFSDLCLYIQQDHPSLSAVGRQGKSSF